MYSGEVRVKAGMFLKEIENNSEISAESKFDCAKIRSLQQQTKDKNEKARLVH